MKIDREEIFRYVKEKYNTSPDYPWERDVLSAVLRKSNKKWYGLVMNVRRSVIDEKGEGNVDILNVKASPLVREILIGEGKAIPAYHMNKRLWISIPLDGGISFAEICGVIDESYCGDNYEWFYPAYALRDTVIHANDRICKFRIMEKQPKI